jgi:hypothetical protein
VAGSWWSNLDDLVVFRLVAELVDVDVALALLVVWTGCREASQVRDRVSEGGRL